MFRIYLGVIALLGIACGPQDPNSQLNEAWDAENNPIRLSWDRYAAEHSFQRNFNELPLSGKLSQTPWSGDYWATYRGGISYRWNASETPWEDMEAEEMEPLYAYDLNITKPSDLAKIDIAKLSPAEKYDLYLGDYSFPLTNYERDRTEVMKTVASSQQYDPSFEIPSWEGLCHAWAPATLHYQAPAPVTMVNPDGIEIPFGASDIKGLLTYFVHQEEAQPRTITLGNRCEVSADDLVEMAENGEINSEEYRLLYTQRLEDPSCRDTNAGAFHLVLTNQIALLDEGFVVDITRDAEVWNQGVYQYQTEIIREVDEPAPNAAPGTVRGVLVRTVMNYVNEVDFSFDGSLKDHDDPVGEKIYHYWLELDSRDQIIGGEWASINEFYEKDAPVDTDEKDDRPDFMWKVEKKDFMGFFAPLKDIYEKSIRQ